MAAWLALATSLHLHPNTQPWGGTPWWQWLKTLTNTCEDRLFFFPSFSPFCLPSHEAKHSTFFLPSCQLSPIWWHFQSWAWEGRCVHGLWFLWIPSETHVATHTWAVLLYEHFEATAGDGTTLLSCGCKHVACGNLPLTQGTSEVQSCPEVCVLTIWGTQGVRDELLYI